MKVCILGDGLTSLALAKALVNKGISTDVFLSNNNKKKDKSRTIGISKSNIEFFNKNILNIEKFLWDINKIEIYSENLNNRKIIDFNDKKRLFSIIKNHELNTYLVKQLKKNKFFRFKKRVDNYEIIKTPELAENPLNFPGYKEKLERGRKITGHHCAVMVAQGVKDGIKVTSFAIDSRFNGGSINASAGEAIVYCFQKAIDDLTPVVAWSEGGGQAMQESNIALHFMVKTVLAANTFKDSTKLPFINIYTNKCYGGITASFAAPSIADICFAEPSMVGFAGQHIVKNQTREDLPEGFQSSAVLVEKGMCDGVFNRKEINEKIIGILKLLLKKNSEVNSESLNETSGTNIQTREAS